MIPSDLNNRNFAILAAAKAMGHEICSLVTSDHSIETFCVTCRTRWSNDQDFTCPKYEGITYAAEIKR